MKAKKVQMGIKPLRQGLHEFAETFKAVQHGKKSGLSRLEFISPISRLSERR